MNIESFIYFLLLLQSFLTTTCMKIKGRGLFIRAVSDAEMKNTGQMKD